MNFTWLYDTVNNVWHIFSGSSPNIGDVAYDGTHVMSAADQPSGNQPPGDTGWPHKCPDCVVTGSAAGLPIT